MMLDLSNLRGDFRPAVEQADEVLIELVDLAAQDRERGSSLRVGQLRGRSLGRRMESVRFIGAGLRAIGPLDERQIERRISWIPDATF